MTLKAETLAQFTGTEQYWRHPLKRDILFTDGVKYVADTAGAYWLLDVIVSAQMIQRVRREEFQVWILKVKDSTGIVIAENGNSNPIYRQDIEFTDFPLSEIRLFFSDGVIMLPGEW